MTIIFRIRVAIDYRLYLVEVRCLVCCHARYVQGNIIWCNTLYKKLMRKIAASILAILMLVLNCGLCLHMHFCMGNMVRIAFTADEESAVCSRCGMEKESEKKGCCEDVLKIVKTDEGNLLHSLAVIYPVTDGILPKPITTFLPTQSADSYPVIPAASPVFIPPDIGKRYPLYISFHSLLI